MINTPGILINNNNNNNNMITIISYVSCILYISILCVTLTFFYIIESFINIIFK